VAEETERAFSPPERTGTACFFRRTENPKKEEEKA